MYRETVWRHKESTRNLLAVAVEWCNWLKSASESSSGAIRKAMPLSPLLVLLFLRDLPDPRILQHPLLLVMILVVILVVILVMILRSHPIQFTQRI